MTDKEFAMEALGFIRAMVNSDEHYTLSEKGGQHFESLIESVGDRHINIIKDHIMRDICKIEPAIEKIKSIAHGGHLFDGGLHSDAEVIAASIKRFLDKLNELHDKEKRKTESTVEFESADDVISKLFGGKE